MSSSAISATTPRAGICSGCGKIFQLGGSIALGGYIIPAHHSTDFRAAKRGTNCSGSDRLPAETRLVKPNSSFV